MEPTPLESLILRDPGQRNVAAFWRPDQLEPAARALAAAEGCVIIATGFPVAAEAGGLAPETDGPDAALALGQALGALDRSCRYLTDPMLGRLLERIGAFPVDVVDWRRNDPELSAKAREYLEEHEPSHLVAIERPGRSRDGRYFTMKGRDITEAVSAIDELFLLAKGADVRTVGIGDGGNEIGMGGLPVEAAVEHGELIASVVAVDWPVVAGVSTWGVYGLIGALSQASGRDLLPSRDDVEARLETLVELGAVDGVTGRRAPLIDGLDLETTLEVLDAVRALTVGGGSKP